MFCSIWCSRAFPGRQRVQQEEEFDLSGTEPSLVASLTPVFTQPYLAEIGTVRKVYYFSVTVTF